jgi:hypothetical protein
MKAVALAAAATAVLTAMPVALGHGNIVDPAAQWSQGYPSNGYASTIDGTLWGPIDGGKYGYGTSGTIKYWKGMFPQKGGGSMSALIAKNQKLYNNKVDPECGLTTYKESARSKLPAEIEWSGFTTLARARSGATTPRCCSTTTARRRIRVSPRRSPSTASVPTPTG